jgi:cobalt/nickel transport protein
MTTRGATDATGRSSRTKLFVLAGLLVALVLAGLVSYYASADPDGLTKVSEDEGFAQSEEAHDLEDSPLAGYSTKDVDNERLSGATAGVIGVGVTFVLAGGVALLVRRRGGSDDGSADDRGRPVDAGASGP